MQFYFLICTPLQVQNLWQEKEQDIVVQNLQMQGYDEFCKCCTEELNLSSLIPFAN